MSDQAVDLVILGASGFTGKYVIREALKFLLSPSPPKIGLAGRNLTKLAGALAWASSPSPPPPLPLFEVNVSVPSSLSSLCRKTKVILNCVGPFPLYGEPVVSACIEAGIDYLDICGETEFVERIEALHHEKAVRKGSLVVSACGYDSVPADLGLIFNSRQWVTPAVLNRVDAYLVLESDKRIVLNMGTYKSAVLGLENANEFQQFIKSRPERSSPQIPGPPPSKGGLIEHQKLIGLWAVTLPSADPIIVRRTLAMLTENPHGLPGVNESDEHAEHRKKYWSDVKPAHFGVKIGSKSLFGVVGMILIAITTVLFGISKFGRSLLVKYPEIFSFGSFRKTGPTEEEVESASFKLWFIGRGYRDGNHVSRRNERYDKEVITRISGPEVGYVTTPIILMQCALLLLDKRSDLPKGGVLSPGIVFGPAGLQERLQENGISFDVIKA